MGFGIDIQAQKILEKLKVVFGNDAVLVQIPGQLQGADNPSGRYPFASTIAKAVWCKS
jgi:hypothetical protein